MKTTRRSEHVVYINCSECQNKKKKQFVYITCSELVVFMYWTSKSMNNLLSYCGIVDARISASEKDLPLSDRNFSTSWWVKCSVRFFLDCRTILIFLECELNCSWEEHSRGDLTRIIFFNSFWGLTLIFLLSTAQAAN